MKKTILSMMMLAVATVVSVVFTACDKASSFEKEAKVQMEKTLKEMAKNPDTFKITDVETKFSNDSTCVLHVKSKGQNGFGGWNISRHEYIYIAQKNKKGDVSVYEAIGDIDDDDYESVYEKAKKGYDIIKKGFSPKEKNKISMNGKGWDNDTKECRAYMIHFSCLMEAIVYGRELNDDNKEKDDWK